MSSNISITKNCEYCGDEFEAKTLYTRYCSHLCNQKHYKQRKRKEKIETFSQSMEIKETKEIKDFKEIDNKPYLSLSETAQLVGTSTRTIQRLISRQQLKVAKIGRRIIIKRTEIDNLFK